jgi:DNA-binding Lrp family transcriptional regulator
LNVAFLLLTLDGNTPAQVAREAQRIPGVSEAYATLGPYDVVVVVRAEATRDIPALAERLRRIHGVVQVVSCVAV